jgi:pilus assembly protein CpaF
VVGYVVAVESVQLSPAERADLTEKAYGELFGYGPLDRFFTDPSVTTIAIDGIDKLSVRYGHGDLLALPPAFEDDQHLRRVISHLLRDAGAELRDDQPYIETGLRVEGRPVSISLVGPPAAYQISADIRVHPAEPPSLASIAASEQTHQLLRAIALSPHGFVVVGEPESGKTTLLAAMATTAVEDSLRPEEMIVVERTGELHLPGDIERLVVRWPVGDQPGISFGMQIHEALSRSARALILDEVRSDEPESVAALLDIDDAPRLMWALRGATLPKRLAASLGMLARRAAPMQGEDAVRTLYERLPFVITVRRHKEALSVHAVGEWQFPQGAEHADYIELMAQDWEGLALTGRRASLPLDLPERFWR